MTNQILCDVQADGKIVTLSFNRTDKLNAIDNDFLLVLRQHIEQLANDSNIAVLVLQSEVSLSFCSGIDVSYVQTLSNEQAKDFFMELATMLESVINFPKPTIAVTRGYTYGVGADLALACDLRLGGKSTKFRFPGPQFGVLLGTKRLIHEVGPSRARGLALTNTLIDANRALDYGILHEVFNDDQCIERAHIQARNLLDMPYNSINGIRKLCRQVDVSKEGIADAVNLTRQSISEGDFKVKFDKYLNKFRHAKKN